ncbi:hypothetical protein C2E23DRAFT_808373 [Lenzites betulinus]|nr:hypothetical protein C2E23DRAFT_808373 [Lenzites betulinus]
MLTPRRISRGLLFLSVAAVLLSSSVSARPAHEVAFPAPTRAPRALFPLPAPTSASGATDGTAAASDTGAGAGTSAASAGATASAGTGDTGNGAASGSGTNAPSATDSVTASDPNATGSGTGAPANTDSAPASTPSASAPTPSNTDASQTSAGTPTVPANTPTPTVSQSLSIDADGGTVTLEVTVTPTLSDSASASPSSSSGADQGGSKTTDDSGISKSTIIGLSVAGGVALIGIITFVVWKFTRKRFEDDDFDNEAIKWPELNAHGEEPSHALPANRTGGAGFETSSQVNLTRPDSRAGSVAPSTGSAADLYVSRDPYAVPPLPHLNPGVTQPYRDDPGAPYYDADPYAPAPPTEAIPMTQINRGRSPAPQMAYGYGDGRVSPAPQQALGLDPRARSPGPGAIYGGHMSPAPPAAGRMSPGPQAAYGPGAGY